MNEYIIIHISNLHFGESDNLNYHTNFNEWYKSLCQDIRICSNDVQEANKFLVISGDISFSAKPNEYYMASKIINTIRTSTNIKSNNTIIVPGNHDNSWLDFDSNCIHNKTLSQFKDFLSNTLSNSASIPYFNIDKTNKVVFMGFNSTSNTNKKSSYGYIDKKQISFFSRQLSKYNLDNYILIAVSHHGLDTTLVGDHYLRNSNAFQDFMNEWSVNLLLHAGGHIPGFNWSLYQTSYGKHINVAAGTISPERWRSSFQNREYQIIEIKENSVIQILTRQYDSQSGEWTKGHGSKISLTIEKDNKFRPKLFPKSWAPGKIKSDKKDHIFNVLKNLSLYEIEDLCDYLEPSIKSYNSLNESKSDFVHRLYKYFKDDNSLNILNTAVKKILSIDEYDKIRIFISSSKDDFGYVKKISNNLEKYGYDVWHFEDQIKPGDCISDKINSGLKNSDILMILFSKDSLKSNWIINEINLAFERYYSGKSNMIFLKLGHVNLPLNLKDNIPVIELENDFENTNKKIINCIKNIYFK
ncbi:TIR domain-containing protein [Desulfospira joergensenii]|uniref:TIR domain-containing protein n=1 Tax=Desulfospira joergensenii TaxID=53329 RepID=UPI0003B6074B|nr:TIR domain-containing protein [Desulfospira joergensenii]